MSEAIIDARHGRFRYLPNDIWIGSSLTKYGEFSELETAFLKRLCLPGHTVVEIGAHIGTQSIPLGQHIGPQGRLYAFEPQPRLFELLRANVAQAGLTNIEARQEAVGRSNRALRMPALDYTMSENFGGVALSPGATGPEVPQVRLDDVLDPAFLHLIKVDAEGMELDALKGAEGLIQQHRPLMSVENDRADRSAPLITYLLGLDYRLMWSLPPLFNPENYFGVAEDIFSGIVSVNMLCLPAERFTAEIGPEEITDPMDHPPGVARHAEPDAPARILFVATQPSSGSTLLAELLAQIPGTTRLEPRAEGQWLLPELCDGENRWDPAYPQDFGGISAAWRAALATRDPEARVVVEKSPPNLCRMEGLMAAFPDHPRTLLRLTRDPLAICASWRARYGPQMLLKAWGLGTGEPPADDLAYLRLLGDTCGARFEMLHGLRPLSNMSIRYEDLVEDPIYWLGRIAQVVPELAGAESLGVDHITSDRNSDLIDSLTTAERSAILDGLEPYAGAISAFGYGSSRAA